MDDRPVINSQTPDEEEEPISALALLDLEASEGFWTRVRRKIDRRVATAQVLSFSWNLPKLIFLEFLEIAINMFLKRRAEKENPDEREAL